MYLFSGIMLWILPQIFAWLHIKAPFQFYYIEMNMKDEMKMSINFTEVEFIWAQTITELLDYGSVKTKSIYSPHSQKEMISDFSIIEREGKIVKGSMKSIYKVK